MMEISNDQKVLYDYLRKTIRKLTFTYSIDANTMYSALHYYTRPRVKYDMNQYNNIYRRCKNLLKKITLVPADTTAKLLVSPKIFDNAIEEKNIHLYNSMTTPLSYTPVSSILSDSTIMSALSIDNNTAPMDYNATELMFPYAFIGPRNGVNILECSILMMLYKNVYNDVNERK